VTLPIHPCVQGIHHSGWVQHSELSKNLKQY